MVREYRNIRPEKKVTSIECASIRIRITCTPLVCHTRVNAETKYHITLRPRTRAPGCENDADLCANNPKDTATCGSAREALYSTDI